MRKSLIKLLGAGVLITASILMSGCSNSSDKFVGDWTGTVNGEGILNTKQTCTITMNIIKNGNSLIIENSSVENLVGKYKMKTPLFTNAGLTIKDEMNLVTPASNGSTYTLTYLNDKNIISMNPSPCIIGIQAVEVDLNKK